MQFTYRNTITADFYTEDYRISCKVNVPAGGLHALLIDPLNSYIEMEDAYVSRINTPGIIVEHFDSGAIRKDNILFIILLRREDGAPQKTGSAYLKSMERDIFLTLPSYEIRGRVDSEPSASPREILVHTTGRFLALYDATASVAIFADITFTGKLILVNKEQVEALCIVDQSQ
jgi:hypothetical protein